MSYSWRPIAPPDDPEALALGELDALASLWQRQRARLRDRGLYDRFWERLMRSWSIETGIIERIYDISEGITRILVERGFEAALVPHGESTLSPETPVTILPDHRQRLL